MLGRLFRGKSGPRATAPANVQEPSSGSDTRRKFLNVGGNRKAIPVPPHFDGWHHDLLDIAARDGVDVVCDARELGTFPPAQYDAVYCSHNLEHYYRHDAARVLRGFIHVLKPDGFAEVRVPDIAALIQHVSDRQGDIDLAVYQSPAGPISAHDMLWGYGPEIEQSGNDYYGHKCGFTKGSLARAMKDAGFARIYDLPPLDTMEVHQIALCRPPSPEQLAFLAQQGAREWEGYPDTEPPSEQAGREGGKDQERAKRVDALYAEAAAAWQRDDHACAVARTKAAIALDDSLPALHYLHGIALLALERHDDAADAMERCLALRPAYPLVLNAEAHAALARAHADLARGKAPANEPPYAGPTQRISVIICSITPQKFERVSTHYHRLLEGVPHEIIGIHDARSLCEGYNRGLRKATGDLLVFSHDDIEIHSPDFADKLRNHLQDHELIGVAGTTRIAGKGWIYDRWPHMHGQVGMPPDEGATGIIVTPYHTRGTVTPGAQALDGVLLACRRELALDLAFDETTFDGWHLYDFDFSFRAWRAGRAGAICNDLLLSHASRGGFGPDWLRYAARFIEKHRDALGPITTLGATEPPQLPAVLLRSTVEWRLFAAHLCARED